MKQVLLNANLEVVPFRGFDGGHVLLWQPFAHFTEMFALELHRYAIGVEWVSGEAYYSF